MVTAPFHQDDKLCMRCRNMCSRRVRCDRSPDHSDSCGRRMCSNMPRLNSSCDIDCRSSIGLNTSVSIRCKSGSLSDNSHCANYGTASRDSMPFVCGRPYSCGRDSSMHGSPDLSLHYNPRHGTDSNSYIQADNFRLCGRERMRDLCALPGAETASSCD
jgi:hypothetical protein